MKFTPQTFGDDGRGTTRWGLQNSTDKQNACDLAQAAFDKWLSEQPRVYASGGFQGKWFTEPYRRNDDTHTARLVDIREIEK